MWKFIWKNSPVKVSISRFKPHAKLPTKATKGSAAYDLYACGKTEEPSEIVATIGPGETCMISTGLNVKIPSGWEIQVRSRSGMAAKYGVHVLNSPGTIDEDYFGSGPSFELKVILHNTNKSTYVVNNFDRVAQILIKPIHEIEFKEYSSNEWNNLVKEGKERTGGFGSSGK